MLWWNCLELQYRPKPSQDLEAWHCKYCTASPDGQLCLTPIASLPAGFLPDGSALSSYQLSATSGAIMADLTRLVAKEVAQPIAQKALATAAERHMMYALQWQAADLAAPDQEAGRRTSHGTHWLLAAGKDRCECAPNRSICFSYMLIIVMSVL